MVDVNGDGRADIVGFGSWGVSVSLSTGTGFTAPTTWLSNAFNSTNGWNNENVVPRRMVDVSGDGRPDIVGFSSVGVYVSTLSAPFPDLLNTVTNGLGATTSVSYKPLTDGTVYTKEATGVYPVQDIQAPMYVVSSSASSDGIGGNYVTSYRYTGAKSHLWGGGFLGFRVVTSEDPQTGMSSSSFFRQDYPYQGLPVSSSKSTASGVVLNTSTTNWIFTTDPTYLSPVYHTVGMSQSVESGYDLPGGAAISTTTTCNRYDTYGNPLYIGVWTTAGTAINCAAPPVKTGMTVKETTNVYSNDTANWFLGRLNSATVTSTAP
ncbi:MAG: toxin TcdB middle/N-terminal domain-containing protein [Gallionella sp.]